MLTKKDWVYILITLLILFSFFALLFFRYLKTFRKKINESFETIDVMVKKTKDEIDKDNKEWLIFNASKKDNKYILIGSNSTYTAEIKNSVITIYKNKKLTGTKGVKKNQFDPSTTGRFDNTVADITYSRGEKRFNINIGNNSTVITGYGGFANDTYPYPWSQVVPIIYKEGGSTIAMMDYVGNIKDLKDQTYLPLEILVSKDYEKYIPLFFQVYVLSNEYIVKQ